MAGGFLNDVGRGSAAPGKSTAFVGAPMVGVDVADAPVAELIHRLRMYAREGGNMKTATDLMDRATACLQGLLLQQLKGFCVEVKLKEFIQDTEDYVNIDLDSKRNKILEVNVLVGLAALVHAAGSCAYGVFGMNFLLDADGEPRGTLVPDPGGAHAGAFRAVAISVAALSVLAWVAIVWGFRRDGFIHIIAVPKLPLPAG